MSRIETWEVKKPGAWSIFIDPFFDPENARRGRQPLVSVHSREEWSFEIRDHAWQRAGINWSALGQTDPGRTEIFAKVLVMAAEQARQMDVEHGFAAAEVKTC